MHFQIYTEPCVDVVQGCEQLSWLACCRKGERRNCEMQDVK